MSPTLPLQPSLEHLKQQAKDLLKAHQHGDATVCATLRLLRHLAQASDAEILTAPLTLRQAQHALAKAYGFTGWADLKAAVETAEVAALITGSCFCGSVRYQVKAASVKATVCYCAGCRRASAAPAVAWITVPAASFRILQGELCTIRGRETEKDSCDGWGGVRGFCANCGTHITFVGDGREHEIDITTCSLETPNSFPPTEDVGAQSKLAWMKTLAR